MASQSFQLIMKSGPTPGRSYLLEKDEIYLGRDVTNDVVINDVEVSRRHARLTSQAGSYLIEDLGSTNGTFVAGQRLTAPHLLRPGEPITLGEKISLSFESSQFDPHATVMGARPVTAPPTAFTQPPPREAYVPPPPSPPPPPPAPAPVYYVPPPAPPVEKKRSRTWLWAGCGCLLFLLCVAVGAAAWYIDTYNMWCQLIPQIPGC